MKLMKVKSREYKGKTYYKYRINLPEKIIKKLGFKAGDELKGNIKQGKLIIGKD